MIEITVRLYMAYISQIRAMPVYAVTNQWKLGGAVAMLFSEELLYLARFLRTDLYILPSSIHELIVVPTYIERPEELAEMVKEVNRTQVRPEDRLSDNAYLFCRRHGLITIV